MPASAQTVPELNFQARLLAPAAHREGNQVTGVEIGDIVARLLLFDTYILDSMRLREVPGLVSAFGVGGLRDLITSRAFQIRCEPLAVAQIGQSGVRSDQSKPMLPSGSYAFSTVRIGEFGNFIHRCMQPFHEIAGLTHKDILRLKRTVASNLIRLPDGVQDLIHQEIGRELRSNPALFRAALDLEVKRRFGPDAPTVPIDVRLEEIAEGDFRLETNLCSALNISSEDVHIIGQSAGFAVGVLTQRLAEMRAHSALTGFSEADIELAEKKFSFVAQALTPRFQEQRFQRVVRLSGFPDVRLDWGERVINVDRLLKVRESDECRAFRDWLRSTDGMTDKQVEEIVGGLRARLGTVAGSTSGRVVRFLASVGIGLLGVIPGALAGAIDAFIVERLFPKSGIVTFISGQFPSIFEYPPDEVTGLDLGSSRNR
jgi:hypothetical protein